MPARDVARARALLREAGVTSPLRLEMMVTNNPVDALLGQVIQAMVNEAGFDLQLRSMEFASQLRDQQQGRFQLSRVGWSGRIDRTATCTVLDHGRRAERRQVLQPYGRQAPDGRPGDL